MGEPRDVDISPETVEACLNFVADDGTKLITTIVHADGREDREGGAFDRRVVTIHNGRRRPGERSLDREGFLLAQHGSRLHQFVDETIRCTFFPEMEALIAHQCGAMRVIIFDHVLRRSRTGDGSRNDADQAVARPILGVHADYTEWSGAERARIVAEAAGVTLGGRHAIIQAWGPIRHPVEMHPLAVADARTVSPDELVVSERRYPARRAQSYGLVFRPAQQWFWFPRMTCDEVLLFKGYDSLDDGRARWVPHSAFIDPGAEADAPVRESIEVRSLALF